MYSDERDINLGQQCHIVQCVKEDYFCNLKFLFLFTLEGNIQCAKKVLLLASSMNAFTVRSCFVACTKTWNAGMLEGRNAGMPEGRKAGRPERRNTKTRNTKLLKPGTHEK